MNQIRVYGIGTALSSVVHGEILNQGEEKGNVSGRRTETVIGYYENDDEWKSKVIEVPVISGNSIRGIGRRMLIDHSMNVLGTTIGELFDRPVIARQMVTALRAGGVTSAGTNAAKISPEKYLQISDNVPFVDMLGMTYQGHYFEGSAKIGILMPYLKETSYIFRSSFDKRLISEIDAKAINYSEFMKNGVPNAKYTKRKENGFVEAETEEEQLIQDNLKEQMIYGTDYIPAGTIFGTDNRVITDNEGTKLAFLAMFALIKEHAIVGGMSGKGHGFIDFKLYQQTNNEAPIELDIETILNQYDQYLFNHKETILETLKSLPETFICSIKEKKSKKK